MQKKLLLLAFAAAVTGLSACGAKCKTCYVEVMGVKSGEKELCGDQLKQAEQTPNTVCK